MPKLVKKNITASAALFFLWRHCPECASFLQLAFADQVMAFLWMLRDWLYLSLRTPRLSIFPYLIIDLGEVEPLSVLHCPSSVKFQPFHSAQGDDGATQLIKKALKNQKKTELKIQTRTESVDGKKNENLQVGTQEVQENLTEAGKKNGKVFNYCKTFN